MKFHKALKLMYKGVYVKRKDWEQHITIKYNGDIPEFFSTNSKELSLEDILADDWEKCSQYTQKFFDGFKSSKLHIMSCQNFSNQKIKVSIQTRYEDTSVSCIDFYIEQCSTQQLLNTVYDYFNFLGIEYSKDYVIERVGDYINTQKLEK